MHAPLIPALSLIFSIVLNQHNYLKGKDMVEMETVQ